MINVSHVGPMDVGGLFLSAGAENVLESKFPPFFLTGVKFKGFLLFFRPEFLGVAWLWTILAQECDVFSNTMCVKFCHKNILNKRKKFQV